MRYGLLMAVPFVLLQGCATGQVSGPAREQEPGKGYGLSRQESIEVCLPGGERDYLRGLVCASSGQRPSFERMGNVGLRTPLPEGLAPAEQDRLLGAQMGMQPLAAGEPDHHIVDAYDVRCGSETVTVFMDMYHCATSVPERAPPGFVIDR